jgi:hypothetical protein
MHVCTCGVISHAAKELGETIDRIDASKVEPWLGD